MSHTKPVSLLGAWNISCLFPTPQCFISGISNRVGRVSRHFPLGNPGGQKHRPRPRRTGRRGRRSPWCVLEAGAPPVLRGSKNQLRSTLPLFLAPRKPSVIKSGSGRMLESLCSIRAHAVQMHPVTSDGTNPKREASPGFPDASLSSWWQSSTGLWGPRTMAVSAAAEGGGAWPAGGKTRVPGRKRNESSWASLGGRGGPGL